VKQEFEIRVINEQFTGSVPVEETRYDIQHLFSLRVFSMKSRIGRVYVTCEE